MRLVATLSVVAAGALTAMASAEARAGDAPPQRARLVYAVDAATSADCPDATVLRREVAERLGYMPFWEWAPRTIFVQVRRDPVGYVARIVNVDADGHFTNREVPPDVDCGEVVGAAALDIAIALDMAPPPPPSPAAPKPPPASAIPAPGETAPGFGASQPAGEPERPAPAPVRLRPPWLAAGGGAAVFTGFMPKPGLAVGGFTEFRRHRASLGAELTFSVAAPTNNVQAVLGSATVAPCLRYGAAFGCGLAVVGWLEAWSVGLSGSSSDGSLFLAVGGRAGLEMPLSTHAFLRLRGDLLVEAYGPRFSREASYEAPGMNYALSSTSLFSSIVGGALGIDAGAYFR